MKTHHKVIIGDLRRMKEVHDEFIHLIITPLPYWQFERSW
jgi:DNA modification methylase